MTQVMQQGMLLVRPKHPDGHQYEKT